MKQGAPGKALVLSAVKSTHAVDLAEKYGELAIDELFTNGALKDVPIIGSCIALFKAGRTVLDEIFLRNIFRFLAEADGMSQDQRDAFYQKLSAEEAQALGDTTLAILNRCDSDVQAGMLGRAFVRLMEGAISRDTFELYAFAIRDLNRYHVVQIKQLYATPGFMAFDPVAANYLSMHGIVDVVISNQISNGQTMGKRYNQTPFGQAFFDHLVRE
jgi:hypothetical protein